MNLIGAWYKINGALKSPWIWCSWKSGNPTTINRLELLEKVLAKVQQKLISFLVFLFFLKYSTTFSLFLFILPGSERNNGEMELCAGSCSSPQGEQLFSQLSLLPPALQMSDVASPSTLLYFSSLPCSHSVPSSQPDSGLLGAGFYQLQLGSFPEDPAPACSENVALRRLQIDCSSPSSPVPPIPDFGIIGSLLCTPSSISSAPIQHSDSPIQRRKTFQI